MTISEPSKALAGMTRAVLLAGGLVFVGCSSAHDSAVGIEDLTTHSSLDPTFGNKGQATADGLASAAAGGMTRRADGALVVVSVDRGTIDEDVPKANRDETSVTLAQFRHDGAVDTAFGPGGSRTFTRSRFVPHEVIVTKGGGIVVAGNAIVGTKDAKTYRPEVMRFTKAGEAEPSHQVVPLALEASKTPLTFRIFARPAGGFDVAAAVPKAPAGVDGRAYVESFDDQGNPAPRALAVPSPSQHVKGVGQSLDGRLFYMAVELVTYSGGQQVWAPAFWSLEGPSTTKLTDLPDELNMSVKRIDTEPNGDVIVTARLEKGVGKGASGGIAAYVVPAGRPSEAAFVALNRVSSYVVHTDASHRILVSATLVDGAGTSLSVTRYQPNGAFDWTFTPAKVNETKIAAVDALVDDQRLLVLASDEGRQRVWAFKQR
ncbi:MAG TPA: hypothetical protein VM925_20750 [Labilithrix sp.]|nr:hypothetical protein [Labilithrix sp.]